ncbi:MAG: 50S ribosomal protein L25 [Planctomycetota bacterium]
METILVKAELRDKMGTKECRRMRQNSRVPAVIYGGKDANQALVVDKKEAFKLLGHTARLIDLVMPGKTEKVLVKELKYNAAEEVITHIDFARVAMDEFITVHTEIVLKGTPKGVKEGGVLEHTIKSLTIKCLPTAIPEKIEVDVSNLELNGLIRVKDLVLPKGVTTAVASDMAVAGVHLPKVEEVAPPTPAEGAPAEPEVITAKKPAEDAEGEAGAKPEVKAAAPKESKDKEHKK